MNTWIRSLILPGVLSVAAVAILISLGNWQMARLAWKQDLIERVGQRPLLPPVDWRDQTERDRAYEPLFILEYEYRRILMEGEYLPDKEARVFTSLPAEIAKGQESGPGYWIMIPVQLAAGGYAVWVNRGFVPEGAQWSAPARGRVAISGLIRPDDPPGFFTPKNRPDDGLYFSRSVRALSEGQGVSLKGPTEPFTVDLLPTPEGPVLPQAGETRMAFTNNHLGYALTWYGLAAALAVVFASFAWTRLRGEIGPVRLTPPGPAP